MYVTKWAQPGPIGNELVTEDMEVRWWCVGTTKNESHYVPHQSHPAVAQQNSTPTPTLIKHSIGPVCAKYIHWA